MLALILPQAMVLYPDKRGEGERPFYYTPSWGQKHNEWDWQHVGIQCRYTAWIRGYNHHLPW